jgi:hypothetical protein
MLRRRAPSTKTWGLAKGVVCAAEAEPDVPRLVRHGIFQESHLAGYFCGPGKQR